MEQLDQFLNTFKKVCGKEFRDDIPVGIQLSGMSIYGITELAAELEDANRAICREAARIGAEEVTGDVVLRMDGMKGLAQLAKANGEASQLSDLVLAESGLTETSFVPRELRKKSADDLRSMLSDVIFAGMMDGLIRSKATSASWN